ncbi:MAG TPA: Xaa-Pro peptidase family protein, partial [Patescibacteria group bacterium]|nr:Xaa-Pro peptidase family protein [Patescibacteria group bacterium]
MNLTPPSELESRARRLQQLLAAQQLEGALILLNSDLFYFTGTVQNSVLFIPTAGTPVLMVKKSLARAREESALQHIVPLKSPKEIPDILASFGHSPLKSVGLELDVLPVNQYEFYRKVFSNVSFTDVSPAIKEIRAVKSAYEIDRIRQTMAVLDQAFQTVPAFLREGMTELELAAQFEAEMRRRGYAGCKMRSFNQDFFSGNLCAGPSGFTPSFFDGPVGGTGPSPARPHGAGWKTIRRNEIVYVDYACVIDGYTGDQTRLFCLGELPAHLTKAFDDALKLEAAVIAALKPGTPAENAYLLSLKLAAEMGYQDHFMGYKGDSVRFIGHGVGLELDELPILAKGLTMPLLPGMTFALEPKFVFPEGAVGIENTYLMTDNGPERLSLTPNDLS